ncbi:MAG: hypothetical protein ACK5W7_04205 [Gemmatimonadaceae bacterium]
MRRGLSHPLGLPLDERGNLTVRRDSIYARVLRGLSTDPHRPTSRAGILASLRPWGWAAAAVDTALQRLVKGGVVARVSPGHYVRIWNELPDGVTGAAA